MSVSYSYDAAGKIVGCSDDRYKDDFLYCGNVQYARIRKWNDPELGARHLVLLNQSDACHVQQVTTIPTKGVPSTRHTLEIKDAHGSLVASYDLSTKKSRFFAYAPYGYRAHHEDDSSWLGFNGEPLDHHLGGIYHLGNGCRVYDPSLHRFHIPDDESPFGLGGANSYDYALGDPVNNIDPSGHVVVGRDTERSQSFLSNKWVNEAFLTVVGVGLGVATGGAGLGLVGAVFGGVTAAASSGLGFAALATEERHPDLSTALSLFSFAIGFDGSFGSVATRSNFGAGRGIAAGAGRMRGAHQANGIRGDIVPIVHAGGSDLGNLYVGGAHTRKLVINGHGFPTGTRFPLPKNMAMEFYSPKGAYISSAWDDLANRIDAGPMRLRAGKVDSPDYYLGDLGIQWWQSVNLPAAHLADMPGFYRDLAIAKGVDILEVTNDITLSMVFDWLHTQNKYQYATVSGHFCRGAINPDIFAPLRKIALQFGLDVKQSDAWYSWWT